jgi:exonuclease-1
LFTQADLTFLYQRVYDPQTQSLQHVSNIENLENAECLEADYIGPHLCDDTAQKIAKGELDPITKKPLVPFQPLEQKCKWRMRQCLFPSIFF